ncbi:gp646 [Bacillus phage G]|uniref:Gp646 n=1 Tax=Bacillus phage G TaxID=2884420 RepID=G3MB26_9CAUD|nr:gp646 [Bacillus phage G]AEO93889.1 gp646 [Bacillus phage G]
MQLSDELYETQVFVGNDDLSDYKIVWLQETNEQEFEIDFIEEPEPEEEEDGFESLYDLIIACAESQPRFVRLIRKSTGEEHLVFDQNNNSILLDD